MSPSAAPERFFEDYPVGSVFEAGPVRISEADIVDFAKRYDPQPFHVDAAAALHGPYGGIIASGWQTTALTMRLCVERYLSAESSLGSPGIDELRWMRPVRPGDVLTVRVTVEEARRSRSRPDRGLVRTLIETRNQAGEIVMSMRAMNLMLLRDPGAPTD
ncbi:MAG: MaoC family dehydratase [Betaproteobacteria bacterium]